MNACIKGAKSSWKAMRDRCLNGDHPYYIDVFMDFRWLSFDQFLEDMGSRPAGYQIDRINGERGYFPDNCRWATPAHNCQNRKRFSTNSTGRNGVQWISVRKRFSVVAIMGGKAKTLYWGLDFYEACCVRAAFERDTNYGGWL